MEFSFFGLNIFLDVIEIPKPRYRDTKIPVGRIDTLTVLAYTNNNKKHGDLTERLKFHKHEIIPPGRVVPSARSLANDVAVSRRRPPSRE